MSDGTAILTLGDGLWFGTLGLVTGYGVAAAFEAAVRVTFAGEWSSIGFGAFHKGFHCA